MSVIGFLLDEHISPVLQALLMRTEPDLQMYLTGDAQASPKGTPDPDLLAWIEEHQCMLVTNNRASMPVHVRDHLALGRHVLGVIHFPRRMNINDIVDELILIWDASLPDEFLDQIVHLPLGR